MGTKTKLGDYDCYESALPDEPRFVLLARDPDFFRLVRKWAKRRSRDIQCGDRPQADMDKVAVAEACAYDGREWRKKNYGKWRKPTS